MPARNIPVSALNQAIYERLEELGHIDPDGSFRATAASKAIFGEDRRQLVEGWVRMGRDPKLDAETQRTLCRFLEVSPRRVLELAGFDTGDDYRGLEERGHIIRDVAAVYTPSRQAA